MVSKTQKSGQIQSSWFAGIILMGFSLLALYLGYLVLLPVMVPTLFAMTFAVVLYPIYQLLIVRFNPYISSLLCCLGLVVIVLLGAFLTLYLAVGEVVSVTRIFTTNLEVLDLTIWNDTDQLEVFIRQALSEVDLIIEAVPYIDLDSSEILSRIGENIISLVQNLSANLISIIRVSFDSATAVITDMIIFFISLFYLLVDGKTYIAYTFNLLPINRLHERQIIKRFTNLAFSWIVVNLSVAFLQGLIATIGFAIAGVPSAIVWGLVTMMASFIPFIGTTLIWFPIGIIYLLIGKYGWGVFILVWGAVAVGTTDNIIRPFLMQGGVEMHPLILFLAVLGGFFAFGISGLIIGPLTMVFISTLIYIYQLEFGDQLRDFHNKNTR